VDGKLTRRSFTSREGKLVYVTEIVIDAISSIGNKKDANSGLSIPKPVVNKPAEVENLKSIDESFPEHVVKQTTENETHQPEKPKYDSVQDVE
jgi:single-stranded DNA-binding protein